MVQATFAFYGGPWDGERRAIPSGQDEVHVPVLRQPAVMFSESADPTTWTDDFDVAIVYKWQKFGKNPERVTWTVYAWDQADLEAVACRINIEMVMVLLAARFGTEVLVFLLAVLVFLSDYEELYRTLSSSQ